MNLTISSFYCNFSNMHPNMIKFCYRVYYLQNEIKNIHRCIYYGIKNRDLVLMRTYLSKYLYEQAKEGEHFSFYHKDFISAKLVHLRQFDLKDCNINNNGEIELEKYYETLMAQATFRVKFRNNDGKKTTQYLVFQRIMSESNPFEKWKLVFGYDKTFPDDDQLVKQ